ncbi:class I SAM-dependent methyltransferase [Actinoplanes sp. LDG1-06]|uniref:Class I SAM-dependent methyltransferase n=1 Tax=Paractinoplanes ovalisporus TaxID=2810368 RepID=A0ABS2AGU8_9ACTN|nr:class I SAM-dependent methyltransferase [Actinoplanes ovalisporus]MBM2619051.1 class I SAM-dependent methyltransferase [Actinoplanes ovalisporus]
MHMFTHAEQYDRHAQRAGRKLYDRVVADAHAAGLPTDTRVLDVGTGPGRIPRALTAVEPAWTIDGLDLSPQMIEYARRQSPEADRVTFTVGDVAALPYPDDTFDLVVSSLSQHHWSNVDGGIRDLARVLRPGGRLWIYDVRWSLFRATRVAERCLTDVRREPVRLTRWPIPLIARLHARAT